MRRTALQVLDSSGGLKTSAERTGPDGQKKARRPEWSLTVSTHLLQIQTVLSVLESRQISMCMLADFTADREFHPALKTFSQFSCLWQYIRERRPCQPVEGKNKIHGIFILQTRRTVL